MPLVDCSCVPGAFLLRFAGVRLCQKVLKSVEAREKALDREGVEAAIDLHLQETTLDVLCMDQKSANRVSECAFQALSQVSMIGLQKGKAVSGNANTGGPTPTQQV